MELDAEKLADEGKDNEDTEANLYQLILACQKVFSSLQKAINNIPNEFIDIFSTVRGGIVAKWPESSDAVYKAVGGFFFLRFVCPSLTAPHVYGLLEAPPNQICQRQLVLITKVIQVRNPANRAQSFIASQFVFQLIESCKSS